MKIVAVAETPLGNTPDYDCSIYVPENGELPYIAPHVEINRGIKGIFTEHFSPGRGPGPDRSPREFPAINTNTDFYFLWIEERKEWVGVYYTYDPGEYEQNIYGGGHWEKIDFIGPMRLDEKCADLIAKAYGVKNKSNKEITRMSPSQLEDLAR